MWLVKRQLAATVRDMCKHGETVRKGDGPPSRKQVPGFPRGGPRQCSRAGDVTDEQLLYKQVRARRPHDQPGM